MFYYTLIDKPKFKFDRNILEKIFEEISNTINKSQTGNINIVFLDNEEIKKLNKQYRGIDKCTDVLSFHYFENFENFEKYDTVGEVILSEDKIYSQSKEYGIKVEKEFYNLIIHSILHILGYDHENEEDYKEMYSLECRIWKNIFNEEKI